MKKRLFVVTTFLVGLFILASCGNNDDAKTEPSYTIEPTITETKPENLEMSVIAPAGAPSVCLAKVINDNSLVTHQLGFDAKTLPTQFSKGEADAIIAPINMGAIQYKNNGKYQLAAVVTWGNLYFASYKTDFKLSDLNNQTLVSFGENTINDVIVKKVLTDNNITCTIEYKDNTNLTKEWLASHSDSFCVVAEPALSSLTKDKTEIKTVSVQEEYGKLVNKDSYPQAGCFVRVGADKKIIDRFLSELKTSIELCSTDISNIADICVTLKLGAKPVLLKSIPNSNIKYVKASEARAEIEAMYNLKPQLFGGELMADSFYYE